MSEELRPCPFCNIPPVPKTSIIDGKVGIEIYCFTPQMWMTDQQARDLASALQVWIERNVEVEE